MDLLPQITSKRKHKERNRKSVKGQEQIHARTKMRINQVINNKFVISDWNLDSYFKIGSNWIF